MRQRDFRQVDVFTSAPYRGNSLAVVLDGSGLSDEQMQRFARWTHLSETTYLLPPRDDQADYRVRIFTPGGELPFAGHPTLGSCHAWLEAGGTPRNRDCIVQDCEIGRVRIRRDGTRLAFAAPASRRGTPEPAVLSQVMEALGLTASQLLAARSLDNGPVWLTLLLDDPLTVLELAPDHARLGRLGVKVGVAARYPQASPAGPHLEVRAFAAAIGVPEDPVTGSLNAALAQWLHAEDRMPARYVAAQGACLGRAGRVHVEHDALEQAWIGGASVTCISGSVLL